MKNFTLFLVAISFSIVSLAQTPGGINYQTVIRDGNGNELANISMSLQMSIRIGAPNGDIIYVETHDVTSNSWGLVNLVVGNGAVQSGNFSDINWGSGEKYLETAIDTDGQGNYTILGVTQFLSVPYSLHAANGMHSMTTEQRDAIENPPLGMAIFNITTNCLNYFNGYGWYETCGDCTPMPSPSDAGPDQYFSDATTATTLDANTPEYGIGIWSVDAGSGGVFEDLNDPNTLFTGEGCQVYELKWTITSPCGASEDLVSIEFDTPPSAANAGQDQIFNDATVSTNLEGSTPEVGTGTWSVDFGNGGSFDDANNPTALFTGNPCESYNLKWTISNACGSSQDMVDITFNTPPTTADAGPDQTFNDETTSTNLEGNTALLGTGTWGIEAGTGGSFADVTDPTSLFTGAPCETYTLKWTIMNACGSSEDIVDIIFNTPPTDADAGVDQTFNDETTSTMLEGNTPLLGTGTWSIEVGTGGTFADISDPTTLFTGDPCESYTLKWTILNACGLSEDMVDIIFNTPPTTADAGPDQLDVVGTATTLAANTPEVGTGEWSILSGTGGNISEPGNPASVFTGSEGITYELQWMISNNCGSSTDNVLISFAGGGGDWTCGETFTDTRDMQEYETVVIGDQCWMAENLNIGTMVTGDQTDNSTIEKWCTSGIEENCDLYGGKYMWDEMMQYVTTEGTQGICPDGWYVATDGDWTILTDHLGGLSVAGGELKSTRTDPDPHPRWNSPNTGATNSSGFSALPAGVSQASNRVGSHNYLWTSSIGDQSGQRWARLMYNSYSIVDRYDDVPSFGFSVRCIISGYVPVNQAPEVPASPTPEDGATNQTIEGLSLSWTCTDPEGDPLTYDVYFGTENPPAQVSTGQSETSYEPGTLEYNTQYFWKIVAYDEPGKGNSTEGPVWSFTTEEEPAPFACGEPITDSRDGQTYETVLIGEQCWMAENLNIGTRIDGVSDQSNDGTIEKYCYNNDPANCETYGGLYQWDEMMQYNTTESVQGICPDGWVLPTDEEWKMMEGAVDSQYGYPDPEWDGTGYRGTDVATNLKSATGWNGNDSFGFSALPGGNRNNMGDFTNENAIGYWWSSSQTSASNAYGRYIYNTNAKVFRNSFIKPYGWSVRCIKSDNVPINQPPNAPSSPNPEDGATNQTIEGTTLLWTCTDPEGDPLTFDVYFGTSNPPLQVSTGQSETTYDPGTLAYNTQYFWKIIAHDDQGNSTEGAVWSFSTDEESVTFACGEVLTDNRDGNTYQTVQIGNQCWMAENLAFLPDVSASGLGSQIDPHYYVCDYHGSDTAGAKATENFQNYGVLYNYPAAIMSCPTGWKLPSYEDWDLLVHYVGVEHTLVGQNLKSTRTDPDPHPRWNYPNQANNISGFTGFPGGLRAYGDYNGLGGSGFWWSSTISPTNPTIAAYSRTLTHGTYSLGNTLYLKDHGLSVRCLVDYLYNYPPETPSNPYPIDGSLDQPTAGLTISWDCTDPENDPLTYDIYLGTDNPPALLVTGHAGTSHELETLQDTTLYYWKVVAYDDHDNFANGPVWNFTTLYDPINFGCGDQLLDVRDGQSYATVQIGDQCWMAENLNIGTRINGGVPMTNNGIIEKNCYFNIESNCDTYGGLYQWNEMMQYTTSEGIQGICPYGWYIPTDDDWKILEGTVDSQYNVGDPIWSTPGQGWRGTDVGLNLKSTSGWDYNGNGQDLFGFRALPVGWVNYGGIFARIDEDAFFSTSTESSSGSSAFGRWLNYDYDQSYRQTPGKVYAQSIRCIKSDINPSIQPSTPYSPSPADGTSNQMVEGTIYSWTCTHPQGNPLTYDVYSGTENPPAQIATGQSETTYEPGTLQYNTTYFWKIIAHDDLGNSTEGPVWSFVTEPLVNQAPNPPTTPSPEDGATNQTIEGTSLSWTCSDPESDPLTYDVYFGTENPPAQVATGQSESTYDPGTLAYNTQYFWKVVAYDDQGNSTEGSVWSFSTMEETAAFACGEVMTDTRDGNTYETVQIGEQCWMAQDVAWLPSVSPASSGSINDPHYYVYGYQGTDVIEAKATSNYQTYGTLYNWSAMMNGQDSSSSVPSGVKGVCPEGWHVPSDEEWKMLEGSADSQYGYPDPEWDGLSWRGSDVAGNLKEAGTSHWFSPNTDATNSSGFTSLPSGNRTWNGSFSNLSYIGFYWTTTEIIGNSDNAWFRYLQYNKTESLRSDNYSKAYALSVRCILNEGQENLPPSSPSSPNPEDGAMNQTIEGTTLSWTSSDPENDPLTYDVYFGADNPPVQVSAGQSETTYDPGTLQLNNQYFWKVVAHDDQGNSTEGSVWSFTTEEEPATFACGDMLVDSRDDQQYTTVQIGDQCWMAENLNIGNRINGSIDQTDNALDEKYCYNDNESNCETFGGLYQWNEMMQYVTDDGVQGICPDGWHVPTDEQWKILEGTVDSQFGVTHDEWDGSAFRGYDVGYNLKSTSGWNNNGNGNDMFGFGAKPAGLSLSGTFHNFGSNAHFHTSAHNSTNPWNRVLMFDNDESYRGNVLVNDDANSVRCIKG